VAVDSVLKVFLALSVSQGVMTGQEIATLAVVTGAVSIVLFSLPIAFVGALICMQEKGAAYLGGLTTRSRLITKAFEFFLRRSLSQPIASLVEAFLESQLKRKCGQPAKITRTRCGTRPCNK
jgi:hypothetical protein